LTISREWPQEWPFLRFYGGLSVDRFPFPIPAGTPRKAFSPLARPPAQAARTHAFSTEKHAFSCKNGPFHAFFVGVAARVTVMHP